MKKNKIAYLLAGFLLTCSFAVHAQSDTLVGVNFATTCLAPPAGWRIENVDGSCTWRCESGGITQNNHSSAGCANAANDWLITPPLLLNKYKNEILNYTTNTQYAGGSFTVKYSTNYPGTGNPGLYTWGTLGGIAPGASGNVSLSAIVGDTVYIGFQYTSAGNATNQAARWTITDIMVRGDKSVSILNQSHRNITPVSAILGAEITDNGGMTITERGIVWSTTANPVLATANKVARTGTLGVYDTLVTGLPAGTQIYYRGYARTGTEDFYSAVSTFYTLANEPAQHATAFDATTIGSSAIALSWTPSATASGYLILQKINSNPAALPADASAYTAGQTLDDAVVARVIASNAITTDTIKNLLSGTRYYFTLIPYGVNGTSATATLNYLTAPLIPSDNDSTLGLPASSKSDIAGIAGSEATTISSIENTAAINLSTDGKAVWQIAFRDGGQALIDEDYLPTVFNQFMITPATGNTANWATMIQSVGLFDDSTGNKIGTAAVSGTGIAITGLNLTAADNNQRTATLRLSLKSSTALPENTLFRFMIMDTSVRTASAVFSSQEGNYATSSDVSKNKISVSATKIRIITQPPATADAGVAIGSVAADLVDVWNNTDVDTTLSITVSSVKNNLVNAPVSLLPVSGKATFNNLVFNRAYAADTLLFEAGTLTAIKSTKVKVKNGSNADVIATPGFVYTTELPYASYQDSLNLTTANSVAVFGLTLRDAGTAATDADPAQITITSLRLSLTNFQQVKTLALFDSTQTRLAEVYVTSGTIDFNNINVTADDDKEHKLEVRATFKKVVTDRTRIQFKVTNVGSKADTLSSQLVAADGGGASSSSVAAENRIAVVGTQLNIIQQPLSASVNEAIYPAITIKALDVLGNQDYDNRIFTVSAVRGALSNASVVQVALSPNTGIASFSNVLFADSVTGAQLQFNDGVLSLLSDSFNVNYPVWFRSAKSGDWDSASTWQYSTDTGLTWLNNSAVFPDAAKHGRITISEGHTVTMRGSTTASANLDETIIEKNATLITPVASSKVLGVNNGKGIDLTIFGTLKHNNGTPVKGIVTQAGAEVVVMPGGVVELAAPGYAKDWAANPSILYKNNAVYVHNTTQTNAIEAATYFAGSPANEVPVFRIGANYAYGLPGDLTINGITEVSANKTVRFSGPANVTLRNGLQTNGNVVLENNTNASITGNAVLGGNGSISINDNASLVLEPVSVVALLSNQLITTNNKRLLYIKGTLNGNDHSVAGNANINILEQALVSTAHLNGAKGLFAGTGTLTIAGTTAFVLNGNAQRQQAQFPANTTLAKLTIANPYGATLTNALTVSGLVDLQEGSLFTDNNGVLVLSEQTQLIHYNTNRFISGRTRVSLQHNVFLPLGKSSVYAPVSVQTETADSATYEIEYFDTLTSVAPLSGSLKRLSGKESWMLKQLTGTVAAKFTVQHRTVLDAGETLADIRLAALNNTHFVAAGPVGRNATATQLTSTYINPDGIYAIAIDSTCTSPVAPAAANDTVCYQEVAALQVPSAAGTLNWYSSATAETPLFTGNGFVTEPLLHDTAFWVESKQRSCASPRVMVHIAVSAPLAKPVVGSNQPVCRNTTASLQASGNGIKWFTDAALQNKVAEGNAFVTGAIDRDTLFYAASSMYDCRSEAQQVVVFTKANPAKPFATGVTICKGNNATIAASANAATIKWYTSVTDTHAVAIGNSIVVPSPLADTSLYAEASESGCVSVRTKVTVAVKEVPVSPQITTQGYACKGSPVTLRATGTDTIRWYISDTDSLPAATGNTYTTAPLTVNTLFFVDAVKGACSSPKLAFPVAVVQSPSGFVIRTARSVRQYDSVRVATEGNTASEYTWNFGEGATPVVITGAGPHYVRWATAGVKHIRLTATNKLASFACAIEYDTVITVTPSTGFNEDHSPVFSSTVYPNPAKDLLNIEAALKQAGALTIRITDALGKTVWSETATSTGTSYQQSIDISRMRNGLYLLQLELNGKTTTHKVIINP